MCHFENGLLRRNGHFDNGSLRKGATSILIISKHCSRSLCLSILIYFYKLNESNLAPFILNTLFDKVNKIWTQKVLEQKFRLQ